MAALHHTYFRRPTINYLARGVMFPPEGAVILRTESLPVQPTLLQLQLRKFKLHPNAGNYAIIVACLAYIGVKYNLPVGLVATIGALIGTRRYGLAH
jgi:choline-glycine betaine transporter